MRPIAGETGRRVICAPAARSAPPAGLARLSGRCSQPEPAVPCHPRTLYLDRRCWAIPDKTATGNSGGRPPAKKIMPLDCMARNSQCHHVSVTEPQTASSFAHDYHTVRARHGLESKSSLTPAIHAPKPHMPETSRGSPRR